MFRAGIASFTDTTSSRTPQLKSGDHPSRRWPTCIAVAAIAMAMTGAGTLGFASPSNASSIGPVIDQAAPMSGWDPTGNSAWVGSSQSMAQIFIAQSTGSLTAVKIPINRFANNPGTNYTISLFATSSNLPTGAALGSVTFLNDASTPAASKPSALPTDRTNPPGYATATFANPIAVTAGTRYAITLSSTDPYPAYLWFAGVYCIDNVATSNPTLSGTWSIGSRGPQSFWTYVDGTPTLTEPTALAATTAKNARIPVSFTQCKPESVPITNYEYELDGSGTWVSAGTTESPVTVPNLLNGTTYSVRLRAVYGSSGTSAASTAVTATPQIEAPSAPRWPSATHGDSSVTLSFEAPQTNGGSAVTNYEWRITNTGDTRVRTLNPASTATSFTVSGLTNGTHVQFQIRAVNAAGAGEWSNTVGATPGLPGPVVISEAYPDDGAVEVRFSAPAANGGTISNYEYHDSTLGWTPFAPPLTQSPLRFTGLTNGADTTIYLRAVNEFGQGEAGSINVTPGSPDAPALPFATPTAGGVSIDITPCRAGLSSITGYEYYYDGIGWTPFTANDIPVSVTGLTDGQPVTVNVRAVNALGAGPVSSVIVTPGVGQSQVTGTPVTCARTGGGSDNAQSGGTASGGSAAGTTVNQSTSVVSSATSAMNGAATGIKVDATQAGVLSVSPSLACVRAVQRIRLAHEVAWTPVKRRAADVAERAPRVTETAGTPMCLAIHGLPKLGALTLQVRSAGRWLTIGAVASDAMGRARTPVMALERPGTITQRVGSHRLGWRYVKVRIVPDRVTTSQVSGRLGGHVPGQ